MKKHDLLVAVDVCVDVLLSLGAEKPLFGQREQLIGDYRIELGGSAGIFACGAAKLGLSTYAVGRTGADDFGAFVCDKLRGCGVNAGGVCPVPEMKTSVGVALCMDDHDRAILTYNETIDADLAGDFTDALLDSCRHIHIASYFLMKRMQRHYPEILRRAKQRGLTVSLDTNWDPDDAWEAGLWDILKYVDVFLPNEQEAIRMTGASGLEEAVQMLSRRVPVLAVKLGERGALAWSRGNMARQPAMNVPVVDTVGAGDSFDAGFVYGFLRGLSPEDCLRIGCLCGERNVTSGGGIAGQATEREVRELMDAR